MATQQPAEPGGPDFARYRALLRLSAAIIVDPRLRSKFDTSDIVQQTMLEAWQAWDQHRGQSDHERLAWLQKMLANNLLDAIKHFDAEKRDARRECSLDESLTATEGRLHDVLADDATSPSQIVVREERDFKIAEAIAALPEDQCEALILQRWHGWTLAQIAERLGKTTRAVAGLLSRALQTLRRKLPEYGP